MFRTKMPNTNTGQSLLDKITSHENIFNAIYCLESYVFEKGLLDVKSIVLGIEREYIASNDLELYYALGDKYNHKLIDKVICICQQRLNQLFESEDDLFEISVFFKLKGMDENDSSLKLRPLHTARLLDMICMVSILMCLMFDDTDGKRKLSDLSKLIPHNFYGNVPSTDVKQLFKRWTTQYQEYTQNIIDHCRTYQNNHRYLTEVCLDIKNFFPSVSPQFLYDYILGKLSATYTADEDRKILKKAIAKLLFFKVRKENISIWLKDYYGVEDVTDSLYTNCGIPQGLPQSYFFGNLCMIEVKKFLMRKEIFKGDAYFYVDDSVIYVQTELNQADFQSRLKELNACLAEFCKENNESTQSLDGIVPKKHLEFHKQLPYVIHFHEEGKSTFCHIDKADNYLEGMENLRRETSMASGLYENLDDIDDSISYKKLSVVNEVVDKEISILKEAEKNSPLEQKEASRLKMLKRFKKFYLYRVRMLKLKTGEKTVGELLNEFETAFLKQKDLGEWFEKNEEEIFQSEYRLLIQKSSKADSEKIAKSIADFEKAVLNGKDKEQADSDYLYFKKDAESSVLMKGYATEAYASLLHWVKENYCDFEGLLQEKQFEKFYDYLDKDFGTVFENGFTGNRYTLFVASNSSDYQRRILNAFYSASIGVPCSDNYSFLKANSRTMNYTELRTLTRLRNRRFDLEDFRVFMRNLEHKDISNQMKIDMALLSVIGTFVRFVRNPEWIDSLILTHRITENIAPMVPL